MRLDPKIVRQLLVLDPDTGKMTWLKRDSHWFKEGLHGRQHIANVWNSNFAGKEAFTAKNENGYRIGTIFSRMVKAHRVAWALHYGEWPSKHLDHINGIVDDNRICNLRDVTNRENHRNAGMSKSNTSGVNGVGWCKQTGRWAAYIKVDRKFIRLGRFHCIAQAAKARAEADVYYGFSDRHGKPLHDG